MRVGAWRWTYVALGAALRVALLQWGVWQDAHAVLPYTDVDYVVYNDGARALWSGCRLQDTVDSPLFEAESDLFDEPQLAAKARCARGYVPALARFVLKNDPARGGAGGDAFGDASLFVAATRASYAMMRPLFRTLATLGDPYTRATYRYTPLLALLVAPAHATTWAPPYWGKVLFALTDVLCAVLMWAVIDARATHHAYLARTRAWATHLPGVFWLLNPFPAQIATRGSADSVVIALVLACLALLLRATPEMELVGTHAVPGDEGKAHSSVHDPAQLRVADEAAWYGAAALLALAVHVKLYPVIYGASVLAHLATYRRHAIRILCHIQRPSTYDVLVLGFEFAAVSAMMYALLNLGVWLLWGQPFVRHALLYHVARQDHRHNFSVYFLPTYLARAFDATDAAGPLQALYTLASSPLVSFVPQLLTCAYVGFRLGGRDLVLSCAVQTVVFVALNKVYTSQYFLWYLGFVPVLGTTLAFRSAAHPALLLAVWGAAQGIWLYWAYQLEFRAQDTFVPLWLSSLLLLAMHVYVVQACLTAWTAWRARARTAHQKRE
ncbi:GPI mannosyltransferase 1 [Malassezia obtusa]|uniref:GPI mannosyltransferase 1 n=1 Tax=Malassezia obtusa TaxID=76774 RepID=A0AAF0E643_9BASI|nr:GPI mannosyltransferase 1 [Malassezia obtusa]